MLDLFNIQVENPVAVLDQEQSKKFLKGKDSDKWDFFCKATELERLDNSYCGMMASIEEMEEQEKAVKRTLKGEVENVKELEKRWVPASGWRSTPRPAPAKCDRARWLECLTRPTSTGDVSS